MEPTTRENILAFLKEVRQRMETREWDLAECYMNAAKLRSELEYLNEVALSLDNLTQEKVRCTEDIGCSPRKW